MTGDVKINAGAHESPIQGILNQTSIPLEERAKFLKSVLDKYVENAVNDPSISAEKIDKFKKEVFGENGGLSDKLPYFTDATDEPNSLSSQTAWYIECALDELYAP